MTRLFFTILFLGFTLCYSQEYTNGCKLLSMANSGTAMVNINSNNIGVIGSSNHSEISSSTIQRQNLSELNEYNLSGVYNSKAGAFRVRAIYSGYSIYKEGITSFGFSKKLSGPISFGAEINSSYTSIESYSTKLNINASIGALILLSDNLNYGVLISPTNYFTNTSAYNKQQSALLSTGFSYHEKDLILNLDFVKQESLNLPSIRLGFEYTFYNTLFLRLGTSIKPYNLTGGFGFKQGNITFDFGYSSHEYLQNTYGLGISYTFEN